MSEYALRLENGADTIDRVRQGDALGLFPKGPLNARSGLRPDGGGDVSVVDGSMTVQVSPFTAWVDGSASDAQGGYPFVLDATATLTITDGDATLDRVDTVVAQVQDNTYDGSGATLAQVTVVEGTPGSGAPVLPGGCVPLRDVNVPAGSSAGTGGLTSSNLGSDRRQYLAAVGGILRVAGVNERDALTPQPGMAVYRADTGKVEVYDGTSWAAFKRDDGLRVERGSVTVTIAAGDNWEDGPVTFAQPFPTAPTVQTTVTGGTVRHFANAASTSATGFSARVIDMDGSSPSNATITVDWVAYGEA